MSINTFENYGINRGTELMLRKKGGKKQPELKSKFFNFEKVFSLLNREIYLKIEFDIMKKN